MLDGGVSCGSTGKRKHYWLLRETEDYAVAAGWPVTFTTSMAGVGWLETGENTTTSSGAYVEIVTHLGTKKEMKDEDN